MTETSVLIVGGGYAGLATAVFLARHGHRPMLVDRHPGATVQGRARGINQRTMEIYRAYGLADAVERAGRPFDGEAGVAFCPTLAAEWTWLVESNEPRGMPALTAGEFCMADQSSVEPILLADAVQHGLDHRPGVRLVSFDAGDDAVEARLCDVHSGRESTVTARYLIGADGHRSGIRDGLGIERAGHRVLANTVSIVFGADLEHLLPRRALFWIIGGADGGAGAGLVSTAIRHRWGLATHYDPQRESVADFTTSRCRDLVRAAIGQDVDVVIEDVAGWTQEVGVATSFGTGRVFLVGDAAHVWPPAMALGANTAVADAHNLAWKLDAVLRGRAGAGLLDTYDAERRPLAATLAPMIVEEQARREGGGDGDSPLPDVPSLILGQTYDSAAVLGPPAAERIVPVTELDGRPGTRLPHVDTGSGFAVHDLMSGSFLLVGDGPAWASAVAAARAELGVEIDHLEVATLPPDQRERCRCGAGEGILVRPDGYVAWRGGADPEDADPEDADPEDAAAALSQALRLLLQRGGD